MQDVTTIGIDLAKNYIQLHGVDHRGNAVYKKRVSRNKFLETMVNLPKCLVGMEACGGSNYWASELLKLGHDVKLMSPQKVKHYTDHHKSDARDAKACAEAVGRASMQFVPLKTTQQMEMQMLHRVRSHAVKARTALMNMIRGLLLEFGVAIPKGKSALMKQFASLADNRSLSGVSQNLFHSLKENLTALDQKIKVYTDQVIQLSQADPLCQRLETIDGIGPITSTALVAKIGHGGEFKRGRGLSAYLGLVPRQASSGDKRVLLGITKHGDRYLRQLLIHGGRSVVQAAMCKNKLTGAFVKQDPHSQWVRALKERVGMNKASVAVANKNARLVIGVLRNEKDFDAVLAH